MRQSIFIGKVKLPVDLRTTQQGTPIATLQLAIYERKGDVWEEHEFKVIVFGESAKRIAKQAQVGSEIVAFCRPESREYTDQGGRKRRSEDHVANWIRVCVPEEA